MAGAPDVVIIVNPIAGGGRGPGEAMEVQQRLDTGGRRVELVLTDAAGHAQRAAREAAEAGIETVLVCGGDGTINEAVQGLAHSDTALAVMPLGTANVLARDLKLSKGPKTAAALILGGRRRRMDLGRAAGRYFICMASAGFDAYVTEQMALWRKGAISYFSYVGPTWRALCRYPFEPMRVTVDGKPLEKPAYHLIVGNGRSYGGPFTMTPRAEDDDGLLDAVAFEGPGHVMLALYMLATTVRMHHRLGSVRYLRGKRFEVESARPVPMQLDGDFRANTPGVFEIVPGSVTVLVPSV